MIEQDTIRLLRECDAGVRIGISSIDESLKYVKNPELRQRLERYAQENTKLGNALTTQLHAYQDTGKEPSPMAKGMSWLKTNVKLTVNESDGAVADLITDGCHMGVKTISRYLNQYKAADEKSKKLAKKLIGIEESLAADIRMYL